MKITKSEFGMTKNNKPISLYTIENASGADRCNFRLNECR